MAFVKIGKPKQFSYTPVYYDQEKEELEERIHKINRLEDAKESGEYMANIKGQFKKQRAHYSPIWGKQTSKRSAVRIISIFIYAALIIAIFYLIMTVMPYFQDV